MTFDENNIVVEVAVLRLKQKRTFQRAKAETKKGIKKLREECYKQKGLQSEIYRQQRMNAIYG